MALMKLRLSYDLNDRIFSLSSPGKVDDGTSLSDAPGVGIDLFGRNNPVGLEVLGFDAILPLGKKGYSPKMDTLSFGNKSNATAVVENEDLVAYLGYDEEFPDGEEIIAIELRNASKHLASLISAITQRGGYASEL